METQAKKPKAKAGPGRPRVDFDRDLIDSAKEILGQVVFASKAVKRLMSRHRLGRDSAYKLVDIARDEVIQGLREEGSVGDPATAIALFLTSIMADGKKAAETRIAAANALTRLLALGRLSAAGGSSASDVERFLADLLARQKARAAVGGEAESGPLGRPDGEPGSGSAGESNGG